MHEMAVAGGIINILSQKLAELGDCKLIGMQLAVGKLSGIEEHSLRFALDTLLVGAGFADVELHFHDQPALFKCSGCSWQGQLQSFNMSCPDCEGSDLELVSGQDVILERIEVE